MKNDIQNRDDIDLLMLEFYSAAMADETIGYLFTEVAKLDLDEHLPVIGDFWESMLFQTGDYARHGRNPLHIHAKLDEMSPLLPEHFYRWLEIFGETVDRNFTGERANLMKFRANAIANRFMSYLASAVYL